MNAQSQLFDHPSSWALVRRRVARENNYNSNIKVIYKNKDNIDIIK